MNCAYVRLNSVNSNEWHPACRAENKYLDFTPSKGPTDEQWVVCPYCNKPIIEVFNITSDSIGDI
jgi:hypothetical protein